MQLIDTHAHSYSEQFDSDLNEMIIRAKQSGLDSILLPAVDAESHERMLKVEANNPGYCFAMMGVHPCSIRGNYREELKIAEDFLAKRKFIGVGEIGLDFYWDISFKEQQFSAFRTQIEWALHYDLPIAIHSRNANEECISVVKEMQNGKLQGVFHCFSGDAKQAQEIVDLGFYLGIGGVLTFKKSGLDEAIKNISLNHVVLETDAPYLAPVPFRGKRNESSYLTYIAQKLADVHEMSKEEIGEITTANAKKLFRL